MLTKVVMFANVSPALCSASETLCSLAFAERCNRIEMGTPDFYTEATTEDRSPGSHSRRLTRRSSFSVGSTRSSPPSIRGTHTSGSSPPTAQRSLASSQGSPQRRASLHESPGRSSKAESATPPRLQSPTRRNSTKSPAGRLFRRASSFNVS